MTISLYCACRSRETRSVFRSLDGGTTWEDVELEGLVKSIAQLLFDPRSPDTLYVLTQSSIDNTARFNLYRSGESNPECHSKALGMRARKDSSLRPWDQEPLAYDAARRQFSGTRDSP